MPIKKTPIYRHTWVCKKCGDELIKCRYAVVTKWEFYNQLAVFRCPCNMRKPKWEKIKA